MKTLKILILSGCMLACTDLFAQYNVFTTPQTGTLNRNPAFTGSDSALCVGVAYWRLPTSYFRETLSSVFLTGYIARLHGHVGISFLQDNLSGADRDLLTSYAGLKLSYAQDINLGEKSLLKLGVNGGPIRNLYSFDYLGPDVNSLPRSRQTDFDMAVGFSLQLNQLTLAASSEHVTQPVIENIDQTFKIDRISNYYASYNIELGDQIFISPYFGMRRKSGKYLSAEIGEVLRYRHLLAGLGFFSEDYDGYKFHFGYQADRFRVLFGMASVAPTFSTQTFNSYELSFVWKLKKLSGHPELVKTNNIFQF